MESGRTNGSSDLVHCIYASASDGPLSESDMHELLLAARENNVALGVTGMLLYDKGAFFQVLEGRADVVATLFRKIALDTRHRKVLKLISEPIDQRSFECWSMGHAQLPAAALNDIDGMNDFFKSGKCFIDLDEGRAKQLLKAFSDGRWRFSIEG